MHIVGPQIHETRFTLVPGQKIESQVDKIGRPLPPLYFVLFLPDPVAGGNAGIGIRTLIGGFALVEPIGCNGRSIRHIPATTHVPFAEMARNIAILLESPGH